MGADLMRWLYCRHNPAVNINFGPTSAAELRNKFTLKLWNTYAFFCNYARLDNFDPIAPQVPMAQRPDIDRWILSDLQQLVKKAREAFDRFNLMAFCLEAERFVDDMLSNWYIRRNRRRFWKGEAGSDKLAAYQTLYTVLLTLTKLFAPIMPFLTEEMYQNLAAGAERQASVHHCPFPEVDASLIDETLSNDMDALLDLVSQGSAARNTVKIKVRQPLAEIKVQSDDPSHRRAVKRFEDQIKEELNLKKVTLQEHSAGPLLQVDVKPNPKTLGPKFGPRLREVQAGIAAAQPEWLAEQVQKGISFTIRCPDGQEATLEPADLFVTCKAPDGWAGVSDNGTEIAIDIRITEALALEGMAREVIRHVQQLRKDANLEMEDRIALYLATDSARLRQAIETHRDYIAAETLTVRWASSPLGAGSHQASVKVDGQPLTIELSKVG